MKNTTVPHIFDCRVRMATSRRATALKIKERCWTITWVSTRNCTSSMSMWTMVTAAQILNARILSGWCRTLRKGTSTASSSRIYLASAETTLKQAVIWKESFRSWVCALSPSTIIMTVQRKTMIRVVFWFRSTILSMIPTAGIFRCAFAVTWMWNEKKVSSLAVSQGMGIAKTPKTKIIWL